MTTIGKSLISNGFTECDYEQYSNGIFRVMVISDNVVSIVSESGDFPLWIPWFRASTFKEINYILSRIETDGF